MRNFKKMNIIEFYFWLLKINVVRRISHIQLHHTYIPSYKDFNKLNHFELQERMRNFHVKNNKWDDIGQHFTVFPDGEILTGRNISEKPAGIYGKNEGAITIENIGNFDKKKDIMTGKQRENIIKAVAILCSKFSLEISTDTIIYHHWYNLNTGKLNYGKGKQNKSCPGNDFFGGNTIEACRQNLLPLIKEQFCKMK